VCELLSTDIRFKTIYRKPWKYKKSHNGTSYNNIIRSPMAVMKDTWLQWGKPPAIIEAAVIMRL